MSDAADLSPFLAGLSGYGAAAQRPFDDLRDVASQLAALLVLAASGSRFATSDHPMLTAAQARWEEARDAVADLRPPPTARHHYRHLIQAADRTGEALAAVREALSLPGRASAPMPRLREAWQEILYASRALPGFHVVDLAQSCCAEHGKLRLSCSVP